MAQAVLTVNSGGSSDLVVGSKTTWAAARGATSADSEQATQGAVQAWKAAADNWNIRRTAQPFDLSALPGKISVSSAIFTFTYTDAGGGIVNEDTTDLDVVLLTSMADETNANIADFNKFGTTVGGSKAFGDIASGTNNITLNSTALAWIEAASGGWLRLGLRNSRDTDNAEPTGQNQIDALVIDSSQLTINYSVPAAFLALLT